MYLLNLAAYCVLKYSLSLKKKLEEEEFDLHMSTYTLIFFNIKYYSTMDREAWHAVIHGVANSWMGLRD